MRVQELRLLRPSFLTPPPEMAQRRIKPSEAHTYLRSAPIPLIAVNKRVAVYNGFQFTSFIVKPWMVGKPFGVFSLTKKLGRQIHFKKKKKGKGNKHNKR